MDAPFLSPARRNTYIQKVRRLRPIAYWPLDEQSGATAYDRSGAGRNGAYSNITLAQPGIGDGRTAAGWLAANSFTNLYSASLAAAFNGQEFSWLGWFNAANANVWTSQTLRGLLRIRADAQNELDFYVASTAAKRLQFKYLAGNVNRTSAFDEFDTLGWFSLIVTASKANDRIRIYVDGYPYALFAANSTGLGTWVGAPASAYTVFGARDNAGLNPWSGSGAHVALWARELTADEAFSIGRPRRTSYRTFTALGDSKTATNIWPQTLMRLVRDAQPYRLVEYPWRIAAAGATVAYWAANFDASLAAAVGTPEYVLCNLGANDVSAMPTEATWKANYLTILDAMRAKWSGAQIYIAKPWRRGETADCNTLAGWIDDLVATRSWLYVGHDERVWLEGGDDGATMTTDGVHYSAAGQTACAAQWKTVLGL